MVLSKQAKLDQAAQWLRTVAYGVVSLVGGSKDASGKASGMRLVLRADGIPSGILRECVEVSYLPEFSSLSDTARISSGMAESGPWIHLFTRWDIDRSTGRLALLRTFSSTADDSSGVSGSKAACGVDVSVQYFFDRPEIKELTEFAHYGEQGWSFDRGGVRRDPNSNLYDYYVEVSHRRTVESPETVFSSNALEVVYVTEYKGLYGSRTSLKDDLGNSVTLPVGIDIRCEWSHDEEFCTWDVRVYRSVKKRVVKVKEAVERNTIATEVSLTSSGQASALGDPPAPANGVSGANISELKEDGSWANTVVRRTEELGTTVEGKRVALGYVEDTQETVSAAPAASPADSDIGVTVRSEKTPGRFYKVLRTVYRAVIGFVLSRTKEETLFATEEEVITRERDEPQMESFSGNGLVIRSEGIRDEQGGWRKVRRTKQEKAIEKSSESVTGVPEGILRVVEGIDASPDPSVATVNLNESIKKENTPGKFTAFARTVFEFIDRGRLLASRREEASMRETVTERATGAWEEPSSIFHEGRIKKETCRLTDRGYRKSVEDQEAVPYRGPSVVVSDDLSETVTVTPVLEQSTLAPAALTGRTVRGHSNVSLTPFGKVNAVTVSTTIKELADSEHKIDETWEETKYIERVTAGLVPPTDGGLSGAGTSGAQRVVVDRQKDKYGLFSWVRTRTVPKSQTLKFEWFQKGRRTIRYIVANLTASGVEQVRGLFPTGLISGVSFDISPNEYGLFSGSITVAYDLEDGPGVGVQFSLPVTETHRVYTTEGNVMKAVKVTKKIVYEKGHGLAYGLKSYNSGDVMEGSSFQQYGDNGYFFKKVTEITVVRDAAKDVPLSN